MDYVDDGSVDTSIEIVNNFKEERIKSFLNSHNFIKTLNMGIGGFLLGIAWMDADEIMLPQRLKYNSTIWRIIQI